jgi:hypothetical protein
MKSVVLIGTSHKYQVPSCAAASKFQAFVEKVGARFHVRAIAEEMSLEALAQKSAARTVCNEVADAQNLGHRYCDPNNAQRAALGVRDELDIRAQGFLANWSQEAIEIEIRESHIIRESYWLEQLLELDHWPALFVCGADHVTSFQALLKINGVSADIGARDWAPRYKSKRRGRG